MRTSILKSRHKWKHLRTLRFQLSLPNRAISLQSKFSKVSSVTQIFFILILILIKRTSIVIIMVRGGEQFSIKTVFLRSLKNELFMWGRITAYTHTQRKRKFKIPFFFCVWKSVSHWILSELIASKKYLPGMLEKACPNQLSVEIRGTYTTCPSKIWINDQHVPSHCKTRISYIEPSLEKVCEHRDLLKIK